MKIDRLIGILSILLQQDKVTAPYLAEKFEVSRRTINRDIEDLCQAGIPLVTTQGQSGGISIMEGYRMERTLLSSMEMQAILTGLQSLDTVSGTNRYQQLMNKLSVKETNNLSMSNGIMINLSSWYKSSLAPKIELIRDAITQNQIITFTYCSPNGENVKRIEPYLLLFQWSSWYVWGYCLQNKDFRLYKIQRILALQNTLERFSPRALPEVPLLPEPLGPLSISITARFDPSVKWRLIDDYGPDFLQEEEDGHLLFQFDFTNRKHLLHWLMSFGDKVELLEPADIKEELCQNAENILRIYKRR
ncbi:helix-turn-helix transcriptional regulator [Anaerosporobacter faecicola]|uniref:helix-turn-helix transcriptional regulator n=1 Tax=Anaerosporobacter faecicola TaxID=2718714 RepID=UPI00143A7E81|nr:YafY family protein [Anaerosporobacter faecicola]